ncbi:MAG: trigger factor, partial [Selenomonadaceae bacterium]|nr:trigger factor [Selenomonadaceae bacterium]
MKVTKESIENQQVALTIEVEAEKLTEAKAKACKSLANRMNIPGFRKGKAPAMIVERHAGKEVVLDEAFDVLYPDAMDQAFEQEEIIPVTRPQLDIVTLEEGKDVVFKITVTPRPEIKLGEYKGLKVEKEEVEITDEDVEHQLEHMREHQGTMVDAPEGSAVKDGDFTTLDFKGFVDGEAFAGGEGKDYPLQIGSGNFIPGFEEQLIGMKPGESRDINVTFPENYQPDLKGKDAVFAITIKSVRERQLPELDDEFAKDISEFDTLEELRADRRRQLQEYADIQAQNAMDDDALRQAADNAEIDVPDCMVERQIDMVMQDLTYQLARSGLSMEDYMKFSGNDMDSIRNDYREEALSQVR